MSKLAVNIVSFFNRNVLFYLSVLIAIVLFMFYGVSRLQLDENIYSIFPQGDKFQKFNKVLKENNLNKQIFFSIDAELEETILNKRLDSVSKVVINNSDGLISGFEIFKEDQQEDVLDYFYKSLPGLLTSVDYENIEEKLTKDSINQSIDLVYNKMTSPNAFFMRKIFAKDPLGIAWSKLNSLKPRSDSNAMFVEDGILFSGNRKRALFTAVLNFELENNSKNEQLNLLLHKLKSDINEQSGINFDYFGTFQISYENSRQVKEDTYLTMIISIVLILLLLIVYYRSFLTPIFFILPAIFSGFCGLGIVGFIQPEISAISIATSAVLMGIVLDYSFHFFTHYNDSKNLLATVETLSFPMLVGSFTTIAAFSALMFTDSVVLQNFGLIALCTLSAAVFFTLLLLPTFLFTMSYKPKGERESKTRMRIPKWFTRVSIWFLLLLTVVFFLNASGFQFDSDLNNLSYHPDDLAQKEEVFTGINPHKEKKLHLFVSGDTKEEAEAKNYKLYKQLSSYKEANGLEEIISIAPYAIPAELRKNGYQKWHLFWGKNGKEAISQINEKASELDFSSVAFAPFEEWTKETSSSITKNDENKIQSSLGLNKLVYSSGEKWNIITSVVLKKDQLNDFKSELIANTDVYVFDVSEMANALMISVQDDFNYLLVFSSLLVLFSLLIIYGRIELALFAFFPMVISWVWILGIASIFDISFNFVNIIVATFIFGLGDDFSIFVTDGLLQKHKTNSNVLKSFKSAIILSGITTIIGTGALYFSKHPAIHSIAIVSVVGIACILLVTLVLQPTIFNLFVSNRTKNKRSPVTFLGLLASLCFFIYFFLGCMLLTLLLLVIIPFPIAKNKKRQFLNYLVSKLAGSVINFGFYVNKRTIHKERLDFSRPSIIIANHTSFLDILLMIMMNPKVIIMVKKWVYNSPVFGLFIRYAGYLYVAEGTEYNLELMQQRIDEGYSIMIFPEGTRSTDGTIKRFHKGAFYLAQELKLDIQPIVIHGAFYVNPKNDFIIKSGTLTLDVMKRIAPEAAIYQQRFGLFAKSVLSNMREQLQATKHEIENANYLSKRVQYNYLYKGAAMEWYVRIKWKFEKENFNFYDSLIQDRTRIYDVGCGLGYLSYFLHYRNTAREITGIDYDNDKVIFAQNGHDKTDKLKFITGDARGVGIKNADVVFFNDVLHYMSFDQQMEVLNRTVDNLNDEGLILIRDGITDISNRHNVTQSTEKYSTAFFGFNKTTEALSFFSSKDIFKFAEERSLTCEMLEQSQKTSNVLFILRK